MQRTGTLPPIGEGVVVVRSKGSTVLEKVIPSTCGERAKNSLLIVKQVKTFKINGQLNS